MNWLGLEEAAKLLRMHPVTLKRKAAKGQIPGCKPGHEWLFIEEHLAEWAKDSYAWSPQGLQSTDKEKENCRSTEEIIRKSGGSASLSMESAYNAVVAPPTKRKRRNSTTA